MGYKAIVAAIVSAIIAFCVFMYVFQKNIFLGLIRYATGQAPYFVEGDKSKILGTQQPFSAYAVLKPEDAVTPGEKLGFKLYQKTGVALEESGYKEMNAGSMDTVDEMLEQAGIRILYMQISWNIASDGKLRDLRIAGVATAINTAISTEDVITTLKKVSWLKPIMSLTDFKVEVWALA
jgi:hypothetical protein